MCNRLTWMRSHDVRLSMQSQPITTEVCEFDYGLWRGVLDTMLCDQALDLLADSQ